MSDEIKKIVFNAFKDSNDYDLYLKILDIIQCEIKQVVITQLSERNKFQTDMLNKINNAGWNDESTHGQMIDKIRHEGIKILNMSEKYDIEQDEF